MNARLMLVVLAAIAMASPGQVSKPDAQGGSTPKRDSFRVLVERNIFLRDRESARPKRDSRIPQRVVVRDGDEDLVLTGLVRQGQVAVAFVENVRNGRVQRLWAGDPVGSGRISAITLDDIEYVRNGATKKIEIGRSLGRSAATSPTTAATQPAGSKSETSSITDETSGGDTAAILERMRRRRQQELGK